MKSANPEPKEDYPITLRLTANAAGMLVQEWKRLDNGKQHWSLDRVVSRIINEWAKNKAKNNGAKTQ